MKHWLVAGVLVGTMAITAAVRVARDEPRPAIGVPVSALPAPDANRAAPVFGYPKVLVIVEENKTYTDLITEKGAPYLAALGERFGQATGMDAGYPAKCPSLAAYLIMTSGSDHGICDDKPPAAHPLPGPSVFSQTTAAGKEWRIYAEDMPANCAQDNRKLFAVRHVPSNYYTDVRQECLERSVPMGTLEVGALRTDVDAGTLPNLAFLIPNMCNDMHGAKACRDAVPVGDDWLGEALPILLNGADYQAGRLAVFIAFDEGSSKDNNIPFVAISPTTAGVTVWKPTSLCSVLATMSGLLAVEPLGCAAGAESMAEDFRLTAKPLL